jgi:hypothetical protein
MSVESTKDEASGTSESVRAIVLAVGALVLLLVLCWLVVSVGAWRLAETWKPGD